MAEFHISTKNEALISDDRLSRSSASNFYGTTTPSSENIEEVEKTSVL